MSSHAAKKRSLPRPRKVRFLDSTIDLGSIIFGAVIVADVSGNTQTYYRFITLAALFLIAWVRAYKQDQPPFPACWTAFKDVAILTCLGLASLVFSLATDSSSPALVNWTVSILLAVPFVLTAHGIRHRQDQTLCFTTATVMLIVVVIVAAIGNTLPYSSRHPPPASHLQLPVNPPRALAGDYFLGLLTQPIVCVYSCLCQRGRGPRERILPRRKSCPSRLCLSRSILTTRSS